MCKFSTWDRKVWWSSLVINPKRQSARAVHTLFNAVFHNRLRDNTTETNLKGLPLMPDEQPTTQTEESQPTEINIDHVMRARREKLDKIRELGINPYPYRFSQSHSVKDVLQAFSELMAAETTVHVTGRIMSVRLMGKAAFAHIQSEGQRIQLYFKKDIIGDDSWNLFKLMDIGDIIGIEATLFITRTEERTLKVNRFDLLTKNMRPLPAMKEKGDEVWFKWSDKEERYRHRPVDLVMNRESRDIMLLRSRIIASMRNFLHEMNFIEVETPVLQPVYGGAAAKPFTTIYNALDQNFYLRIADELYLKRLIIGGFDRVFEIAKDFRNEGIDRLHSPESTMLECYAAYEDYTFCMDLVETLLPKLADETLGSDKISFNDQVIDLTPPYPRIKMVDTIREKCGIEIINRKRDELANEIEKLGIEVKPEWGVGKLIDELFSKRVEPDLIQPVFIVDYPVELSPLAKTHRSQPGLVERFELFIGGLEVANAFSELNDPLDQRQRFENQSRLRAEGDEEAHPVDENFLYALEIGMPPTAGLGVGVDRLVMILTGTDAIRDVILFPALRNV